MAKATTLDRIDKWHKTKLGHLVFALVELLLAYAFVSWALNSGSYWQYALGLFFLIGGFQNLVKIFRTK